MIIKVISLILMLFFSVFTNTFAQTFEFRVLANKGENSVKKKGTEDWMQIKTGATIFSGSEIKISNGGYLGLMHKSGRTMEVKTAKVHDIDQLTKEVLSKGSSVASQYGEFLMAKMNSSEEEDVSSAKLNNLNVTGAVSRAVGDEEQIQMFLPKTSKVLNLEDVVIKWQQNDDIKVYKLIIDNLYSEPFLTKELNTNEFDLSTIEINLEEEGGLFVRVVNGEDDDMSSGLHAIELMTGAEKEQIITNLKNLKSEMVSDDLSLKKLVLAIFYEENKLYLHALSCYNEVLAEYPEVDFYKSAYLGFIERNKDKF